MTAKPTTGYAPVNGTNVYWESRGAEGTPLIVVHGGYGLTMFGDVLDLLARQRQVVDAREPLRSGRRQGTAARR